MSRKINIYWLCAFIPVLVLVGCQNPSTSSLSSTTVFNTDVFSQDFAAYANLNEKVGSKSISESDASDSIYQICFSFPMTIDAFLDFNSTNNLLSTHLTYSSSDDSHHGGIALYNAYAATDEDIQKILDDINTDLATDLGGDSYTLEVDDIQVTGVQVVITDTLQLETLQADTLVSDIEKVEEFSESATEEDDDSTRSIITRAISTSTNFEPDYHAINVYTSGTKRCFYWEGRWDTQSRLDALHKGSSPAFEPDIKLNFGTFLGIPIKGWARPNPRINGHYWASNMPNAYIDTQCCDVSKRSYCVGSTSAEEFELGKLYFFLIKSPRWNSESSTYKKLGYKLQQWGESLFIEGWPWSVGTLAGYDPDVELPIFSMGDEHAEFSGSY